MRLQLEDQSGPLRGYCDLLVRSLGLLGMETVCSRVWSGLYHLNSSLLAILVILSIGAEFLFNCEGRAMNSVLCDMPLKSTRPRQHFSYFYFNIEINPLTFGSLFALGASPARSHTTYSLHFLNPSTQEETYCSQRTHSCERATSHSWKDEKEALKVFSRRIIHTSLNFAASKNCNQRLTLYLRGAEPSMSSI